MSDAWAYRERGGEYRPFPETEAADFIEGLGATAVEVEGLEEAIRATNRHPPGTVY